MWYRESKTVFCKIPYYTLAFSVFQVCTKQHISNSQMYNNYV